MLILLLYFIPLFYLLPNGKDNDLAIDLVFRENPVRVPKISDIAFSDQFRVAFLDTRIFHYLNYPTQITRTPRASKYE